MKSACRESEIVGKARITIVESIDPMSVPSMRMKIIIFCFVSMRCLMKDYHSRLMYLSKRCKKQYIYINISENAFHATQRADYGSYRGAPCCSCRHAGREAACCPVHGAFWLSRHDPCRGDDESFG